MEIAKKRLYLESSNQCRVCRHYRCHRACPCFMLPEEAGAMVHPYVVRRRLRRGQVLVEPGAQASDLFFVVSGLLQVYRRDRDQGRRIVALRRSGHTCGIASIFMGSHPAGFAAITTTEVCCIPNNRLHDALFHHPSTGLLLLKHAAEESRLLASQALALSFSTARQRTAATLILLAANNITSAETGIAEIPVDLNRQQIANMVGLSRQHLAAIVADFEAKGLVRVSDRRVFITDADRLCAIYDERPLGEQMCSTEEFAREDFSFASILRSSERTARGESWASPSVGVRTKIATSETTYS